MLALIDVIVVIGEFAERCTFVVRNCTGSVS